MGVLLCVTLQSCAQTERQEYLGNWVGNLPDKNAFNFQVTLKNLGKDQYQISIENDKPILDRTVKSTQKGRLSFNIDNALFLNFKNHRDSLSGYIQSGAFYYYVTLKKVAPDTFLGDWNAFMVNNGLQSNELFLNIEWYNNQLEAYPFLGDQRFRGFYANNYKMEGKTLLFKDSNTGFNFRATLLEDKVEFEIYIIDSLVTQATLYAYKDYWEPPLPPVVDNKNAFSPKDLNDGWSIGNIIDFNIDYTELRKLIDSINSKALVNTHSVLISKNKKLVFEAYFDGFNAQIPHDLRSASKSISSAIIGIAVDDGIIESVDEKLYNFIPREYQYTKDSLKSKIKLKHLLTMSSGLDVNNEAQEDNYQNAGNPNSWLKTVLEAPMVKEPGTYADYGSANPFLLGVCLNEKLKEPLETYMDERLFSPLGITNYINQTDDTRKRPYFGGGMLLTPRDLLKFGQLYLNRGQWNGKQIISENWVEESMGTYLRLQDYPDKNEYGYLWWHDTYTINGKAFESIEARGAGGQFIFIVPELEAVCVITAGNFRNGKSDQSREIFRNYIIPSMVE